jgi:hypothetical protein
VEEMNKKNILIVLCCTLLIQIDTVFSNNSLTIEQLQAESVVNDYCVALINGDTKTIKQLLGKTLLKKRKKLLDNPQYAYILRERYNNSRYAIFGNKLIDENKVEINVNIVLNEQESLKMKFILIKEQNSKNVNSQFYIQDEIEVIEERN